MGRGFLFVSIRQGGVGNSLSISKKVKGENLKRGGGVGKGPDA